MEHGDAVVTIVDGYRANCHRPLRCFVSSSMSKPFDHSESWLTCSDSCENDKGSAWVQLNGPSKLSLYVSHSQAPRPPALPFPF